jgi:hypothetical protein
LIRQLRRLARPLPVAGRGALALTVYAEPLDGVQTAAPSGYKPVPAAEQGFEGVACLDDAARAAVLYTAIWQRHHFEWARLAAEGLLSFVVYMQAEDGRFANFILDWNGRKNLSGPTSYLGGWSWGVRGMHALASAAASFGSPEYADRFRLGLPWLDQPAPYLDQRAVCVLGALDFWQATRSPDLAARALAWSEEIAASRLGPLLPNASGQTTVHLWAHLQETALARAALAFDRPDLARVARDSAEALFVPGVERSFAAQRTLPFDVSCAVIGLQAVAEATGEQRYAEQAELARQWFHGRNAANEAMYDRQRGRVYDGIDEGRVNPGSGAESNIEGALALLDSLPWHLYDRPAGRSVRASSRKNWRA